MASNYRHRYLNILEASSEDEDTTVTNSKDTTSYPPLDVVSALNLSIRSSIKSILLILPPPFNRHRRDNKILFIISSFLLSLLAIRNVYIYNGHILHPFRNPNASDFQLAYDESNGFFDDIPSHIWKQKKQRVQNQPKHNDEQLGLRSKFMNRNHPRSWYQHNWDEEFTCPHERKVGGISDSAKYICDPHRIKHNNDSTKERNFCLVYSFGRGSPNSRTFDFAFETELMKFIGGSGSCEIHFFDQRLSDFGGHEPEGVTLHPWGLEGFIDSPLSRRNFMTLKETVHHLGHEGRELDVMRIDCEGCEWHTFREWLTSGISARQIVVTLHGSPRNEDDIFELLESNNYVIFHKEADIRYGGMFQEYGFIKLAPEFFSNDR